MFGHDVDLTKFAPHTPSYRISSIIESSKGEKPPIPLQEDDSMDVDDEYPASPAEILLPSHALDLLHVQVIDHFTILLVELVGRVWDAIMKQNLNAGGTSCSIHSQRDYRGWSASQCIEFLHVEKPLRRSFSPRPEVFLSLPYSRGARRGQDWSRKDWEIALDALAETGDLWREGPIRDSIACLKPIVEDVFCRRMRPTGI